MAVNFGNQVLFVDDMRTTNSLLKDVSGDVLCYALYYLAKDISHMSLQTVIDALQSQIVQPAVRLSILNPDETVSYHIPPCDIVQNSVTYNENYTNGQRRNISMTLINEKSADGTYKYIPSVNGIWYGTKIKYEQGILY